MILHKINRIRYTREEVYTVAVLAYICGLVTGFAILNIINYLI